MKKFLLLLCLSLISILYAETTIQPGNVSGTWISENSPYLIEGEITVPDGETLNIQPNVTVEFQGHYKFHVQGRLLAIGESENEILFTINDTTGFGDINAQQGAWQGIRFNNTPATNDSSRIEFCKINYSKANGFDPPCSSSGGGIYVENFDKLYIFNTTIRYCKAMLGGGIALDTANIKMNSNLIFDNEGWSDGGGLYCIHSSPLIENTVFKGNYGSSGGGMACWYYSSPILNNVGFTANDATIHGGGLFCKYYSNPNLNEVTFKQNTASYGAAMNFNENSNPIIFKTSIIGNHSLTSSGAFSCGINSNPVIINSTIAGNSSVSGGVSYIYDSHPVFLNCILWDNEPADFWFADWEQYTNSVTFAYCDLQETEDDFVNAEYADFNWLEGNISEDPLLFALDINKDYLQEDSPCRDAGTAYFEWNAQILLDLDEDEYCGDAPEMGSYELLPVESENEDILFANFELRNYPNPFNPSTTIFFQISRKDAKSAEIEIYNLKGQKIKTFSNLQINTTTDQQIFWDGTDQTNNPVSSGIYFYELKTDGLSKTKKMIMIK